jgi:hypothetical protein
MRVRQLLEIRFLFRAHFHICHHTTRGWQAELPELP